jgi:hypothetical protein
MLIAGSSFQWFPAQVRSQWAARPESWPRRLPGCAPAAESRAIGRGQF